MRVWFWGDGLPGARVVFQAVLGANLSFSLIEVHARVLTGRQGCRCTGRTARPPQAWMKSIFAMTLAPLPREKVLK